MQDPPPGLHVESSAPISSHDSGSYNGKDEEEKEFDDSPANSAVDLDSSILRSIEEVLHIDIPVDSRLLYRESSPRFTRGDYVTPSSSAERSDLQEV